MGTGDETTSCLLKQRRWKESSYDGLDAKEGGQNNNPLSMEKKHHRHEDKDVVPLLSNIVLVLLQITASSEVSLIRGDCEKGSSI